MKPSLRTKLGQLAGRLDELNGLLGAPDVTSNLDRYRALTKEHSDIGPVVAMFREFGLAEADLATAAELANDPAMREFADEERTAALARIAALESDLQAALLPKDPNDERKSARERAATSRRCSPVICCACTCATPSGTAGRRKRCRLRRASWAVTGR